MNDATIATCLVLLESKTRMKTGYWDDAIAGLFGDLLMGLKIEDAFALKAIQNVVTDSPYAPQFSDLLAEVARLCSPLPTVESVYEEILYRADREGLYARIDPDNPNCRLEGPPQFSHPLVTRVVSCLGGWERVCSGEANLAEGLKKQVSSVYEHLAEEWRRDVIHALRLPPACRDMRLFPCWRRFALQTGWTPPDARVVYEEPRPIEWPRDAAPHVGFPPALVEAAKQIGRSMPASHGETRAEQKRAEADARKARLALKTLSLEAHEALLALAEGALGPAPPQGNEEDELGLRRRTWVVRAQSWLIDNAREAIWEAVAAARAA